MLLSCSGIDCAGSDWPITNYSAEGEEPFPPFWSVVYPNGNNPIDEEWTRAGCLYICTSYISQEDADLCALRQAILCRNPPGDDVWYSAPATCTATCPDGTIFYYTVPAGMFVAHTYAEALAEAQAYACEQAQRLRFCIGDLPRCACVGNAYNATVGIDVTHSDLTWTVTGILPPGLQLISHTNSATITGTPVLPGTYAFQLVATDAQGNYAIKVFTIQVVQITNTSLPNFTIGTPYSYQLTATGGSGNYSWRVAIGTLPDGLILSTSGLISGTPTSLAIGGTLTFEVVDSTCETATKQFFTPRIALVTSGTTTIKTMRGYPEYLPSTGTLYKTATWTGFHIQLAQTAGDVNNAPEFCGGARYDYSGASSIDAFGNFTSSHTKNLLVACNKQPFPIVNSNSNLSILDLLGYCWAPDPGSCGVCSSDQNSWSLLGNYGSNSQFDFPANMVQTGTFVSSTPTTYHYDSGGFIGALALLDGVQNFPLTTYNGINGPWSSLASYGDWTATLSDPYTDADATASAQVYTNNSAVAENLPNYRTWQQNYLTNISSRATVVNYVLNLSNLVPGQNYIARIEYWSSLGTHVSVPFAFTAAATTHTIAGTVPTPAANTTITVKKPSIAYA